MSDHLLSRVVKGPEDIRSSFETRIRLSDQSDVSTQKSTLWMVGSFLACVIMATSGVLRGLQSDEPFSSKFTISLANLVLSLVTFCSYKIRGKGSFRMPYWGSITNEFGLSLYKFDFKILLSLVLGGVSEFLTSVMVLVSFSYSLKANIN